ncbi:MAG TPA: DUF4129 domain-containing protein [Actinomycetota bacterium]|nr:DUF4129 domain-containing protein [Actinomycetota bacterium]
MEGSVISSRFDVAGDAPFDLRSAWPAGLAAVAEAGILFLPLRFLVQDLVPARGGPFVAYVLFVGGFVGSVAVVTALRRFPAVPTALVAVAMAVGVLQATAWGGGPLGGAAGVVLLSVAVAFRVATLAYREWQDPVTRSFGVGAVVALLEIVVGAGPGGGWKRMAPLVAAQFFLGSLASRAASVRLEEWRSSGGSPAEVPAGVAGPPRHVRWAGALLACLALALGASVLLGGRGGSLALLGQVVFPVIAALVTVFLFVLANALRPVFWLLEKLHVNLLRGLQHVLERFRAGRPKPLVARHLPPPGPAQRLVGLLILVAVVALLVWGLRRQRRKLARTSTWLTGEMGTEEVAGATRSRGRRWRGRRRRRELPADAVRRWYAEALVALEDRGFEKPSSKTPDEFLAAVRRAFPAAGPPFERLTGAYDDVRYGGLHVEERTADLLEEQQPGLLETFRHSARADEPVEETVGPP